MTVDRWAGDRVGERGERDAEPVGLGRGLAVSY